MTINTTSKALQKAYSITRGYGGYCLLFVQTCYNASPRYPSAISAWNASNRKHETSNTNSIPVGAPIWFAPHGSPYGHVAIYAGNGNMRTTNSSTGLIHTDSVSRWQKSGYKLLGYTDDIEGQSIPDLTDNRNSPHQVSQLINSIKENKMLIRVNVTEAHGSTRKGVYIIEPLNKAVYIETPDTLQVIENASMYYSGKPLYSLQETASSPWLTRLQECLS